VDTSERKKVVAVATLPAPLEVFTKYSSYAKLRRVIALCHRFADNLKKGRKSEPLLIEELNKAEVSILRNIQQEAFA
jgi:hypothetical protein